MKIKIDNKEFDIETKLPPRYEDAVSVQMVMKDWLKLIKDQQLREKRELRVKKLNEINDRQK